MSIWSKPRTDADTPLEGVSLSGLNAASIKSLIDSSVLFAVLSIKKVVMFASIIKFFMPGTTERVITDSSEAMREFYQLRMKGAKMVGVRLDVQPNEVFTFLCGLAFAPEKLLTSNIHVKRKFKSSAGEARHVVIQKNGRNFDIKISKRNKIVNKNYKIHLFDGGTMADYGSLNIHIKQDGVRCFSGALHISNTDIIDGDGSSIARISYLRTPLLWEYSLKQPPIGEERYFWYLKLPPGLKKIRR